MTLHRFFVSPEQISSDRIHLGGDAAAQISRVLRLRPGASIAVFDGSGREIEGRLLQVSPQAVLAQPFATHYPKTEALQPVLLLQALLKGEKMDWVVEKATELGVTRILTFPSARSVPQLREARSDRKVMRWNRIAKEAAEQCGRVRVPEVNLLDSLESVRSAAGDLCLYLADEATANVYPDGGQSLFSHPDTIETEERAGGPIGVVVGPEGGWTPEERHYLYERGAVPLSLGPRILRAETAAVVALTKITLQ
jgi:16S rRNA (uracil1498-N3)-methyltransferase